MLPSTKVDLNHNKIMRVEALDELATVLFPGNRNHQRIFVAVFVELKWAEGQFLTALEPVALKYGFSHRSLETVRAKMRRLGIIDHVSRFNKKHGYREGWTYSNRCVQSLIALATLTESLRERKGPSQEQKERDLHRYL